MKTSVNINNNDTATATATSSHHTSSTSLCTAATTDTSCGSNNNNVTPSCDDNMSSSTKNKTNSRKNNGSNHRYRRTHYTTRDETPLETALETTWDESKSLLRKLAMADDQGAFKYTLPQDLHNPICCGHLQADLDSVAGAMAAAILYHGTAARASDVNAETQFALNYWHCTAPDHVETLVRRRHHDNNNNNNERDHNEQSCCHVILVDFQQKSQLHPSIRMQDICGIIDHHALQSSTVVTERPIFVEIRPWGSVCTILAHMFCIQERRLPLPIAGMMLSAILSDTLNLRSPTTTNWDRRMVTMLVQYVGLDDVNMYAAAQFRAKSRELSKMSPYALVHGDMKEFKFTSSSSSSPAIATTDKDSDGITPPPPNKNNNNEVYTIGYSVIETTDATSSLARTDELLVELRSAKEDNGNLTAMLLAVVDIVNLNSFLLLCGPVEESLAAVAYGGGGPSSDRRIMDLPGMVSRKKDFIPPLARAITEDHWKPPSSSSSETNTTSPSPMSPAETPPTPSSGRMGKRTSSIVMNYKDFANGMPVRVYQDEETTAVAKRRTSRN